MYVSDTCPAAYIFPLIWARKEAIKMAKSKPAPVEDLDDLDEEDLEDLGEDLDDEDVEEDEDDDEDEEETPKSKSKGKASSKTKAKTEKDGIGTKELADALETSGRTLRMLLRKKKVGKDENNRYHWASVSAALKELGFKTADDAKEALKEEQTERLEEMKSRVEKKGKKSKKSKKAPVEDDDE